jgi:hypothetical protein
MWGIGRRHDDSEGSLGSTEVASGVWWEIRVFMTTPQVLQCQHFTVLAAAALKLMDQDVLASRTG